MCQGELAEFLAELNESGVELSEFSETFWNSTHEQYSGCFSSPLLLWIESPHCCWWGYLGCRHLQHHANHCCKISPLEIAKARWMGQTSENEGTQHSEGGQTANEVWFTSVLGRRGDLNGGLANGGLTRKLGRKAPTRPNRALSGQFLLSP